MQAIILVGGFGTRLQSVVADVPKPMAMIGDFPFLAHLLHYLKSQGFTKIILAVHHMRQIIHDYFKNHYHGMQIEYAIETEALGTGGAIINALKIYNSLQSVFVINGDTFMKIDYREMLTQHQKNNSQLTLALRSCDNCSRYGEVIVENENQQVIRFQNPGNAARGLITSGTYLINPDLFKSFSLPEKFSFEHDFLQPHVNKIKPAAFLSEDYFIDIGIPEDYARAVAELPELFAST